jgi:hypothetical protein
MLMDRVANTPTLLAVYFRAADPSALFAEEQPMSASGTDTNTNIGSAYLVLDPTFDAELTRVARGTPMVELLRRYWHPVLKSDRLKDLPVRALGEDVILFRKPEKAGAKFAEYRSEAEKLIHRLLEQLRDPFQPRLWRDSLPAMRLSLISNSPQQKLDLPHAISRNARVVTSRFLAQYQGNI